jgi:S-formylglutathione hydrolase FrmB
MMTVRRRLPIVLFLLLSISVLAQTAQRHVVVRDGSFQSASLRREMKYRILLPADYETSARRYPVLYLLHGLTGHYEDWESRTHLDEYVAGLPLIVAMPEGGDSWYTNSATEPQEKWEDYIIKDFIPHIDKSYRTIQTRHARAIAGLSMGGYGAMKFALKYPNQFVFAASFSGAYTVTSSGFRSRAGPHVNEQVAGIYGPEGSDTRKQNDVYELAKKVSNPEGLPYLWISCGTEDGSPVDPVNSLIAANQEFAALLVKQKIRHTYSESPGAHTWQFWDEQLPKVLSLLMERYFGGPRPSVPKTPGVTAPRKG